MRRYYTVDYKMMKRSGLSQTEWFLCQDIEFVKSVSDGDFVYIDRKEWAEHHEISYGTLRNCLTNLKKKKMVELDGKGGVKLTKSWFNINTYQDEKACHEKMTTDENCHKKMTDVSQKNDNRCHKKMTTLLIKKEFKKDKERSRNSCDASLRDAHDVAFYLLQKILSIKPNFKQPNLETWAKDIDKAIRIDGRTKEQLIACIDYIYSPNGAFWQANILSGKKLREKFDTIEMQAQRSRTGGSDVTQHNLSVLEEIMEEYGNETK